MELRIPEEGKAVYVGEDEILLAYYGSEIELSYETVPPHGDEIFSASLPLLGIKLPFWMYGRNLIFLDAYYLLAETVKTGSWNPITSMLINIHTGEYASLGDWYNSILVKDEGIELVNTFDRKSMVLKDINDLDWI